MGLGFWGVDRAELGHGVPRVWYYENGKGGFLAEATLAGCRFLAGVIAKSFGSVLRFSIGRVRHPHVHDLRRRHHRDLRGDGLR